jgi:hypothetical protein
MPRPDCVGINGNEESAQPADNGPHKDYGTLCDQVLAPALSRPYATMS